MSTSDRPGARPDPSTTSERNSGYGSLEEALMDQKIPLENWKFIRQLTDRVGVASYHRTTGYIKAVRKEGGPDLHITYGYSNGFRSSTELREAGGDEAEIWPKSRRLGRD